MKKKHKHIIVNAEGLKHVIDNEVELMLWLQRLVNAVGMKMLMPPRAKYCEEKGNEGASGGVIITTSHSSIHIWSKVKKPYLRFDLYSCKEFDINVVLDMIREFKPKVIDFMVIARNKGKRMTEIEYDHDPSITIGYPNGRYVERPYEESKL